MKCDDNNDDNKNNNDNNIQLGVGVVWRDERKHYLQVKDKVVESFFRYAVMKAHLRMNRVRDRKEGEGREE